MSIGKKVGIGIGLVVVVAVGFIFINGNTIGSSIQAPTNNGNAPQNPKTVSLQQLTKVNKIDKSRQELTQVNLINGTYSMMGGEKQAITFTTATGEGARIVGKVIIKGDFGATLELRNSDGKCDNLMGCSAVYLTDSYNGGKPYGTSTPVNMQVKTGTTQQLVLSVDSRATDPQIITLNLKIEYQDTSHQ